MNGGDQSYGDTDTPKMKDADKDADDFGNFSRYFPFWIKNSQLFAIESFEIS